MSTEWRLVWDDVHEARHHFAVEEALARLVDEGHSPPTLRLRRVHPAVFIGVHQNTWAEADVAYCREHGIQIVRRMNGGGAVYHEMGSFCFSAFFHRDLFAQSEEELYRLFASPVIMTCADYGITAHFEGRNDVLVGHRKIYGSAQFSCYQAVVQSGTFLVNMNFDVMARALTPTALKFAGKTAHSIQERVTSLSREVGRKVETGEVMQRFASHFGEVLGVRLVPGDLTVAERALAAELLAAKYSTSEWNFGSDLEYQLVVADRTQAGVVSLSANMGGTTIQKARIGGDILLRSRQELDEVERSLAGCSIQEAQALLVTASLSESMRETLLRLLEKLAQEAATVTSNRRKEGKP